MTSFHSDNGSEFLTWVLYEYLTGRPLKVSWTRSRAYRKNDHAHCEHPELVPLLNDLYSQE